MQRYFVSKQQEKDDVFQLTGADYHHISRVMRMKQGAQIVCVTDDQRSAVCEITEITNEYVTARVIQWNNQSTELPVRMTIVSGIPKGDKLEWIVQKGTELGASEFIPFNATRSISKWDDKRAIKKVERLQKIAKEAAEQSYRHLLPTVHHPMTLSELIHKSTSYDYKLIAFEEDAKSGERSNFAHLLNEINDGETMMIVFGPEGGLTESEVQLLIENEFISCGLGPRILRTETAPLYALAAASYQLELLR